MIFQHTIDAVLSGDKTQTRRLVKPGQTLAGDGTQVKHASGQLKWAVGRTYAVQPARAKSGIARIRITKIKREDVRYISGADVLAEGFESRAAFFVTWTAMHADEHDQEIATAALDAMQEDPHQAELILQSLHKSPRHRYDAWALTFKLTEVYKEGSTA